MVLALGLPVLTGCDFDSSVERASEWRESPPKSSIVVDSIAPISSVPHPPENRSGRGGSGHIGRVVFSQYTDDGQEIILARDDGSDAVTLIDNYGDRRADLESPLFSPDGRSILFFRYGDEPDGSGLRATIMLMNLDGSGLRELTVGYDVTCGDWSPDGRAVVFTEFDGDTVFVDLNGVELGRISIPARCPRWSPDGSKLLATTGGPRSDQSDLAIVNVDGSDFRILMRHPPVERTYQLSRVEYPEWSPDGREIAFITQDELAADVFVMDADGGNVRRLTHGIHRAEGLAWSGDGSAIAFAQRIQRTHEIWAVGVDGLGLRRLLNDEVRAGFDWR